MVNREEETNWPMLSERSHGGGETLFSPRFKSVAAMAGWDEEALLIATLIVEDTPDRNLKQKKRLDVPNLKSPLTNSRRKRRAHRRSPSGASMPITILKLDDDPPAPAIEETEKAAESKVVEDEGKKTSSDAQGCVVSSSDPVLPCMDRLREELSCAICLEICFEPTTTACGHSFCKKCLRSAADKCGKRCPKCRQLISNGRSCTVNTVLWNTIQLLFPQEVEGRKAASAFKGKIAQRQSPGKKSQFSGQNASDEAPPASESLNPNRRSHRHHLRRRSTRPSSPLSTVTEVTRTNHLPSQDEDAALAFRLQREEFMGVLSDRRSDGAPHRSSLALARANLRAMASRATYIRHRGRST